jgi:hypothetical protein
MARPVGDRLRAVTEQRRFRRMESDDGRSQSEMAGSNSNLVTRMVAHSPCRMAELTRMNWRCRAKKRAPTAARARRRYCLEPLSPMT